MKTKKIVSLAVVAMLCVAGAFAGNVTVKDSTGNDVTVWIPDDFESLVKSRIDDINRALKDNDVKESEIRNAASKIKDTYDNLKDYLPTDKPFTVVQNGLDDFTDDLRPALSNSQTQQNVWAEAWIGYFIPGFHCGGGVNAGISTMDTSALKDAALALDIDDAGDVPNTLVFPTITADFRLGGIILPFDVGINAMKLNTSAISDLSVDIDFFTIGADVRYAVFKGKAFLPTISVGAGVYYTNGSIGVSDDTAEANLDFSATTFMLSSQASMKVLFLIPFVGTRVLFAKSSVDWDVKADWSKILTNGNGDDLLSQATSWGLLPGRFSGGSSGFAVYPQVFAGLGLDLFVLNLTVSGSYDIVSQILSAAVSVRIAW